MEGLWSRIGFVVMFGHSQRGAVDSDGDAAVLEAVKEGVNERLSFEQIIPFGVV